jgi:hypothetical protein
LSKPKNLRKNISAGNYKLCAYGIVTEPKQPEFE